MNNDESLKRWFLDVVFPDVFYEGDNYWEKVFKEKKEWKPEDAACLIFGVTADPTSLQFDSSKRITGGNLVPVSQIPPDLLYWDCIFTALLLFHPECWPNVKVLIKNIYAKMSQWGWATSQYRMMNGNMLKFMDDLLDEKRELKFLSCPLVYTVTLECKKQPILTVPPRLPIKPKTASIEEMANYFEKVTFIKQLPIRFLEDMVTHFAEKWEEIFGKITCVEQLYRGDPNAFL